MDRATVAMARKRGVLKPGQTRTGRKHPGPAYNGRLGTPEPRFRSGPAPVLLRGFLMLLVNDEQYLRS